MLGDIDGGHDHVMIIPSDVDVEDGCHVPYRSSIKMIKTRRFTMCLVPCVIFDELKITGGQNVIMYQVSNRIEQPLVLFFFCFFLFVSKAKSIDFWSSYVSFVSYALLTLEIISEK